MILRCDMKDLSVWELPMGAEQRHKSTELGPATVQLTPLLEILIFHTGSIVDTLCLLVSFFDTKTADIHCPVGDPRQGKVESCRDLCFHIFPPGTDVAAPDSGGIALDAGES